MPNPPPPERSLRPYTTGISAKGEIRYLLSKVTRYFQTRPQVRNGVLLKPQRPPPPTHTHLCEMVHMFLKIYMPLFFK